MLRCVTVSLRPLINVSRVTEGVYVVLSVFYLRFCCVYSYGVHFVRRFRKGSGLVAA